MSFNHPNFIFRDQHGGILRNKRRGRKYRPLSTKLPLHIVFKADIKNLRGGLRAGMGFKICLKVITKYSRRFRIKIEQKALCRDHIHCLVRLERRSLLQHFLRVVAGQIAQQFEKNGLTVTDTHSVWKYRPFTRIVRGWKGYKIVMDYVRLNEQEARGKIKYSKKRLRGLSELEREILWSG